MNWKGRTVFVTGAGGFIGSHLTERLVEAGARVRALVRYNSRNHWGHLEAYSKRRPRNLEVVTGDVRDGRLMQELVRGRAYVFHLAALIPIPYSYEAPESFVDTNVRGTLNVLEACRRAGVRRLVHTSTSEVYGTARYVPIDEGHPLQAQSPYAASKIGADQLALSYARSFGLPTVVLRPFNTYGPRQSARAVVPTVLASLLAGQLRLALGDTRPVRDFTFVADTARAFMLAAESAPTGDVTNVGSGRGHSVAEVVRLCARAAGRPAPALRLDRRRLRPSGSEVWRLVCDNRRVRRSMGWRPETPFPEGLRRTADYIRAHPEEYKTALYNI